MAYQTEFIDLCIELGVLKFGSFKLKSAARVLTSSTPDYSTRAPPIAAVAAPTQPPSRPPRRLSTCCSAPAYKGIPAGDDHGRGARDTRGRSLPFAFNRKEAKDHGECGTIVGCPFGGKSPDVDDVITASTAIRESIDIIRSAGAHPAASCSPMDRQERGAESGRSAVQDVRDWSEFP